jgi:hypothetical protein
MSPINYNIIKTSNKVEMIRVLLEVLASKNGGDLNYPNYSSYSQGDNIGGQARQKLYEIIKSIKVEDL